MNRFEIYGDALYTIMRAGHWRTRPVFCEDCGAQTGTRSVPWMQEGRQTVICKGCSWNRALSLANDGYRQKQRERADTVPALVGFGSPAKPPAIAIIGNGLYARTRSSK